MTPKGTILVVDDTPVLLKLLTKTLTAEGFQVRPANSGELALASVAASPPELILLDIRMPGLDGFEVCRRLKMGEESRDIPIIFLSGITELEERVDGLKLGAVDFITKPYQPEELLARIRTHLELRRLHLGIAQQADELRLANDQLTQEVAERRQAEEALKIALQEKVILLKEIHHRVKNNLAVVSSILGLQSRQVQDKTTLEVFKECRNRVKAMAKIHTNLYQSDDFSRVDFGSYIGDLTNDLFLAYRVNPEAVTLTKHIDSLALDINNAIPLGLLLNELLSNTLKYAFPEGREGLIRIALRNENDYIRLTVADDGIGFPEDIDFTNTKSLGLQLVMALVQQLKGTINLKREQGTEFTVKFR